MTHPAPLPMKAGPDPVGRRPDRGFQRLAEAIPQLVWTARGDGSCEYVNRRWCEYTGMAAAEALGRGWLDALHPDDRDGLLRRWAESIAAGSSLEMEARLRGRDGEVRRFLVRAEPLSDDDGWAVGGFATATDLDDPDGGRRDREAEARRQLAELRATYDHAPIGLSVMDLDLRWVRINERLAEINGIPAEAHIGRSVRELLPDLADQAEAMLRQILETGEPAVDIEVVGETPARPGVVRTWNESFYPIRDDDGQILGINVVCEETTGRQAAERALRESEARFRNMADSSPTMVWMTDPDGRCTYLNRQWHELTGQDDRTGLGHGWLDAVHPEDRRRVEEAFHKAIRRGEPLRMEYRLLDRDGDDCWCIDSAAPRIGPGGELLGYIGSVIDISDRRAAEEALREGDARLRMAAEATGLGTYDWDLGTNTLTLSEQAREIFGLSRDEPVDIAVFFDRLHPDDLRPQERAIWETMDPAGDGEYRAEFRVVRPDGTLRWVDARGQVRFEGHGPARRHSRFIGTMLDITERRLFEEALREGEERFRTLADNIAQLAWMANPCGEVFWYNRRWYDYTGTDPDAMQGPGRWTVYHPEHRERVEEKFRRCIEAGEAWEDTFPLLGQDGAYRWFLAQAIPIRDEAGTILRWFGTNTDVTEQRAIEEALRESDRRKGEFLAILSHELRNPLAAIRSAVAAVGPDDPPEARAWAAEVVERQSAHLKHLMDDLLDLTRIDRGKIELRRRRLPLAAAIDRAVASVRASVEGHGHELALDLDVGIGGLDLDADPTRFEQILTNLLTNAVKYTPHGGRIELSARCEGEEAVIAVRDTGIGLSPEMHARIFEMFAQVDTSHERAQGGLGIGLGLVKSLVELHGGTIAAASEGTDRGSTFTVRLPMAAGGRPSPAQATPSDPPPRAARGRPLRILAIDDNVDSTRGLARILGRHGHEVHTAHDGPTALDAACALRPDVVLLDIGLPGMSGYQVAERLRRDDVTRRAAIIALSGYGQDQDRARSREAGCDHHLVKPVDIPALLELLDATPANPADDLP